MDMVQSYRELRTRCEFFSSKANYPRASYKTLYVKLQRQMSKLLAKGITRDAALNQTLLSLGSD